MHTSEVAPIKYEKSERQILVRAFLSGMFLGMPFGIVVNYLLGFPTINVKVPLDSIGWAVFFFRFFTSFLLVPAVLTTVLIILFLKEKRMLGLRQFLREFWTVVVFFIILPLYVDMTYVALDTMVGGKLAQMSYSLFTLLVTPFVVLFFAILVPQSRTGRALRRFISRVGRVQHGHA